MLLEQPDEINVLTGMSAEVTAESAAAAMARTEEAWVIPAIAVFEDDAGQSCVWVISDDLTAHKREVVAGEVTGDRSIVIESGLSEGDRVATAAVAQLHEGMKVRLLSH
jgi:multidrug efflux pump subunit AcrA (membrane-fusion protein)